MAKKMTGISKVERKIPSVKGQLNSEYEVIVSPKDYQDFCPGSLLACRSEILVVFGWHFGRNNDLIFLF